MTQIEALERTVEVLPPVSNERLLFEIIPQAPFATYRRLQEAVLGSFNRYIGQIGGERVSYQDIIDRARDYNQITYEYERGYDTHLTPEEIEKCVNP